MKVVYAIEYHDELLRESELEKFAFTTLEEATKELEKNNYEYSHRYNEVYVFNHKTDKRETAIIIKMEVL